MASIPTTILYNNKEIYNRLYNFAKRTPGFYPNNTNYKYCNVNDESGITEVNYKMECTEYNQTNCPNPNPNVSIPCFKTCPNTSKIKTNMTDATGQTINKAVCVNPDGNKTLKKYIFSAGDEVGVGKGEFDIFPTYNNNRAELCVGTKLPCNVGIYIMNVNKKGTNIVNFAKCNAISGTNCMRKQSSITVWKYE